MQAHPNVPECKGFTLIELSIVLVIIGLIVGGILVGQTLVSAAGIRATISQIEKYNQAVNTFRSKYNCFPGDCANATSFFPLTGYYTNGNGNGILDDVGDNSIPNTTGFPQGVDREPTTFWVHLWSAGLADCCNPANMGLNGGGIYTVGLAFPQDKVNGYGISVANLKGQNGYFWGINEGLANLTHGSNANQLVNLSTNMVINPAQAQAFDAKVDDGLPTTGNVYTVVISGADYHLHPGSTGTCVTGSSYNTASGLLACSLWINMQGGS